MSAPPKGKKVTALTAAFRMNALNGEYQPDDEYRMALYEPVASLGPDTAAYTAAGECTGAGYTAGGIVLTGRQVRLIDGVACLDFAAPSWAHVTLTTDGFLIYNASIEGDPSVLTGAFDRVYTPTNGPFTPTVPTPGADSSLIQWPAGRTTGTPGGSDGRR